MSRRNQRRDMNPPPQQLPQPQPCQGDLPAPAMDPQQIEALVAAANVMATAVTNQTQVIQQLGQALQNTQQPQQQQPQQQQPPLAFHKSPLTAVPAGIYDYTSKDGKKHYEQAMAPLFGKKDKYIVEPDKFKTFMEKLKGRAKDIGLINPNWIGMVPEDANGQHIPRLWNQVPGTD